MILGGLDAADVHFDVYQVGVNAVNGGADGFEEHKCAAFMRAALQGSPGGMTSVLQLKQLVMGYVLTPGGGPQERAAPAAVTGLISD
jgi:hypothetical protein